MKLRPHFNGVNYKINSFQFCHSEKILTVTAMKIIILWANYENLRFSQPCLCRDMMPCSLLKVNWRLRGTYRLHLQGRKISRERNQSSAFHCFHAGFLLSLFFRPWRWRRHVPPKRQLTLNGQHGVISQKVVLFITTAVRTSNPTQFMKMLPKIFCCPLFSLVNYICDFVEKHSNV
jgi:hypothetical protein